MNVWPVLAYNIPMAPRPARRPAVAVAGVTERTSTAPCLGLALLAAGGIWAGVGTLAAAFLLA